jgi:hypothetical protein
VGAVAARFYSARAAARKQLRSRKFLGRLPNTCWALGGRPVSLLHRRSHQDCHDGGEPKQIRIHWRQPGRPIGLVEKSYFLFFEAFFAPFFFVDFLAFLAAM